jgi:hypothetical protein
MQDDIIHHRSYAVDRCRENHIKLLDEKAFVLAQADDVLGIDRRL